MILLYSTFPTEESAMDLAKVLLGKKLIACAQVLPEMKSLYEWEKEIKIEKEFILLLKTKKEMFEVIELELKKHHPYKVPCLLEIHLSRVNSPYLNWLSSSIKVLE